MAEMNSSISSLVYTPKIKFTSEISDIHVNFLDTTARIDADSFTPLCMKILQTHTCTLILNHPTTAHVMKKAHMDNSCELGESVQNGVPIQ